MRACATRNTSTPGNPGERHALRFPAAILEGPLNCDERPFAAVARSVTLAAIIRMHFRALSAAVYGIDANLIDVEVDYSGVVSNEDHFHTVGFPDAAVRESRDRVRPAIKTSGYTTPPPHIPITPPPADLKKEGSGFDLPIAIGILGAYGALRVAD